MRVGVGCSARCRGAGGHPLSILRGRGRGPAPDDRTVPLTDCGRDESPSSHLSWELHSVSPAGRRCRLGQQGVRNPANPQVFSLSPPGSCGPPGPPPQKCHLRVVCAHQWTSSQLTKVFLPRVHASRPCAALRVISCLVQGAPEPVGPGWSVRAAVLPVPPARGPPHRPQLILICFPPTSPHLFT